ncbi:hypothetical protein GBAR_LOCUS18890 [Geodia barretti]|uniref:Uncharacterized protein n=2 Tax=Geodia barretti TaxID=519541 RepID=A0AA35SPB0_GEOBA|nr:hypothetical protein GBAR_LOCUS18890 [Geodia barretti]
MHATVMAGLADRSEKMLRRVFQEFFSCLRLCTDLFIVFILECAHCIAFHVLRKLLCGLLFTCLSSLSAPGLTDCYNVVVWPLALCCLQVCRAGGLVLGPCVECLGWPGNGCLVMVNPSIPVNIVLTGQDGTHINVS